MRYIILFMLLLNSLYGLQQGNSNTSEWEIIHDIGLFIFGVWVGTHFFLWQMSKSNSNNISEYVEKNYPFAFKKWYK